MAKVIAGLYQIEEQLGSGGGGVVYLGTHLRLNKKIAIKADKRNIWKVSDEKLRREVDLLKGLSHSHIPQVYDFVIEDGVAYTIMDYIEGESLKQILSRHQYIQQKDIVRWACQLLEALNYLHNVKPHGILHGDIKPANIMLRPDGDICLIDFNISLMLGACGSVRVGLSRGYSSPEHYGYEYICSHGVTPEDTATSYTVSPYVPLSGEGTINAREDSEESTEIDPYLTELDTYLREPEQETTDTKPVVLLDQRSDIYSLGATLYHLITGNKPDSDAWKVRPLTGADCSQALALIINKAMNPDAARRYQTAAEMLDAFMRLPHDDPRSIKLRNTARNILLACAVTFLCGGALTFIGMRQREQRQSALKLAEYSQDALQEGNVHEAVQYAMQALPDDSILNAPPTAEAQYALTNALGVYNLNDGFSSKGVVTLPSAPFHLEISPDGSRFAAVCGYTTLVYDSNSLNQSAAIPMTESALAKALFLNNEDIVCAGKDGLARYHTSDGEARKIWTGQAATDLSVSADGKIVAAVNRDENHAVLYDTDTGKENGIVSFFDKKMKVPVNDTYADPDNDIFALNQDGSWLAVSFDDGSLELLSADHPDDDLIIYDSSDFVTFSGGFSARYFAWSAVKQDGSSEFGLLDLSAVSVTGSYESENPIHVIADDDGIYVAEEGTLVKIDPARFSQKTIAYAADQSFAHFSIGSEYTLTAMADGGFGFYNKAGDEAYQEPGSSDKTIDFAMTAGDYAVLGSRSDPSVRIMQVIRHSDAELLAYDPDILHDEARIAADGRTVMMFDTDGFTVLNMQGQIISQTSLSDPEQEYDQEFRRDGLSSWLEVTWYDGTQRLYSASDGSLTEERKVQAPEKEIKETFTAGPYEVTRSLHDSPEISDSKTGKLLKTLDTKDFITYVTWTDYGLILEYQDTDGNRYGVLMNKDLEPVARMPELCDIVNDKLIFDYPGGHLRESPIYTLEQLEIKAKGVLQ